MSRDSIIVKKAREKSIVTKKEEIQEKKRIFADAILSGASQSDAARAAGYHPSSASSHMRCDEVQQHLAEFRNRVSDETTIKKLDVLNVFIEAIDMARTLADPAQMINGAREIGRMMGYYEPEKIELNLNVSSNVLASKFKQMTDEQLHEIASRKAKVIDGEVVDG